MINNFIFDAIRRMARKETLTNDQIRYNREVRAQYPNISTQGAFNVEMRNLIGGFNVGTTTAKVTDKYTTPKEDSFLSGITTYDNLKFDLSAPYIDADGVEWKEVGKAAQGQQTPPNAERLSPKRLTTSISISREVIMGNNEIEQQLTDAIVRAMYSKVVESMLSSFSGDTDTPKGIFADVTPQTLASVEDLIGMQCTGDDNKTDNVWVISPRAKKHLNTLNYDLLRGGEFLNTRAICENRMESPFIAYMPLKLAVLGLWGPVSITVDNVTQLVNGKVVISIDFYANFAYLAPDLIQLGRFQEEATEGNG